ncbi:hypothetical protein AAFF_G00010960 [Aldrovandia affinis]|uniref:Uncharacterized protein n=1 Tax=Aldrovandia affinis TaxID=143900 RepID=A0AAD7S7C1_9TELE|nr:hypothetical protein AAFF_G00010960 [Aldrovandia affinis]
MGKEHRALGPPCLSPLTRHYAGPEWTYRLGLITGGTSGHAHGSRRPATDEDKCADARLQNCFFGVRSVALGEAEPGRGPNFETVGEKRHTGYIVHVCAC